MNRRKTLLFVSLALALACGVYVARQALRRPAASAQAGTETQAPQAARTADATRPGAAADGAAQTSRSAGGPGQAPGLSPGRTASRSAGSQTSGVEDSLGDLPPAFAGFAGWPYERQVQAVNARFRRPALPGDVLAFYRRALFDARLDEYVRNNMAETLLVQEPADPALHELFLALVDDTAQSELWRTYCVQHLAETVPATSEPERVLSKLRELTEAPEEPVAGRAVTMLGYLESRGEADLGPGFEADLRALAQDPLRAGGGVRRLAAVSTLGRVGTAESRPLLRELLGSSEPALARAAAGALAQTGDASDASRLDALARSTEDEALRRVAESAAERLRKPPVERGGGAPAP